MKKLKKQKGITLIALVITIIILLILAGITIAALTQNGLLKKAKDAKENSKIAECEEFLKLKINETQIKYSGSATLQDFVNYLNDDKEHEYVVFLQETASVNGVIDIGNSKEIYVVYENYTFKIDEKFNIENVKNLSKTEATYEIKEKVNDSQYNIKIKISNINGIEYVKYMDSITKKEVSVDEQSKQNITIDFTANKEEEYEFKIKIVNNEEKTYKLKATDINILQNNSEVNQILTTDGIITNQYENNMINIDTDNSQVKKYYSTDNGKNWLNADGSIFLNESTTVIAKAIWGFDNEIVCTTSKDIKINTKEKLNAELLDSKAFDNDEKTYTQISSSKKIFISPNVWEKQLYIYFYNSSAGDGGGIRFKDKDGNILKDIFQSYGKTYKDFVAIPKNTSYMETYHTTSNVMNLYSLELANVINSQPKFSAKTVYTKLAENENNKILEPYQKVNIEYFSTATKKLYKTGNDEEWKEYTGEINCKQGDIIYAKAIDSNNNETLYIPTYNVNIKDAILQNAFDNNDETYVTVNVPSKLYIDNDIIGKQLYIYFYNSSAGNGGGIRFKDKDGNILKDIFQSYGKTYKETITIPENTVYIETYHTTSNSQKIYSIEVQN